MRDEFLTELYGMLEQGELDDYLSNIQAGIEDRREFLKEQLRTQVKKLFGENADIVSQHQRLPAVGENATHELQPVSKNPFIQKAAEEGQPIGPQEPPQPDVMKELDEVEAKMEQASPIEMRGAMISGLHSSQIWGG